MGSAEQQAELAWHTRALVCALCFSPPNPHLYCSGAVGCSGLCSLGSESQGGLLFPPAPLHVVKFSRLFQLEDGFLERNFSSGGTAHFFDLQEVDFFVLLN